ncbi:MAG: hypothetical protein CMJ18_20685 [Phycisphaeraceae bacterium]|nr:hypothetical protein [Phycisphaeraceae bacterium]
MKSRKKILLVFACCVAFVLLFATVRLRQVRAAHPAPVIKPAVVRCMPLEPRPYRVTESFYGTIEANVRVDMAFRVPGRIAQLGPGADRMLRENDRVEVGDVIARLEPERYDALVAHARARTTAAKAALREAEAGITDAKATLADAERKLKRVSALAARQAANANDLDEAKLRHQRAEAAVMAAEARLESAEAAYQASESSHDLAEVDRDDATLKSPIDGLVADMPTEIGQMIAPQQTIMSLIDQGRLKLVIGVVERKLPLLSEGQRVEIEVLALAAHARMLRDRKSAARLRRGVVTVVPPAADPRSGLFKVHIELAEVDADLRPGMVAKAVVTVRETTAVAIPADAAVRTGDAAYAYFVERRFPIGLDLGNLGEAKVDVPTTVARRVAFEPEVFDRDFYLVRDVPEGFDQVVVEGLTRLRDGHPIQIVGAPLIHRTAEVDETAGP